MPTSLPRLALVPALVVAALAYAAPAATRRIVFVSVSDKNGPFVDNLSPSDFVVREGGVVRDVLSVEPALNAATRIVLLIEEGLTRDTDLKVGVIRLIQRIQDHALISIVVAGQANSTVVPYTSDGAALVVGLNGITQSPRPLEGRI